MVTAFYQMVGEEAPKRRQGQGQWGPLQNPFFSTQSMPFCQLHLSLLASTFIVTMGNCLCPLLSIWDYVHLPTLYQIYSCKIACNTACQVRSVLGSGCHARHCHARSLQHHSAHLSRCPNSSLGRPAHASCSLIQCRQRDLVSLSISPMMCNTVSICRCQNPSMHATCFICVFRLSVLRSIKPPIRPGPIEKRQLCRISRLPAVKLLQKRLGKSILSAPLTALCHRACDCMGVHFSSLFLRDSHLFSLLLP